MELLEKNLENVYKNSWKTSNKIPRQHSEKIFDNSVEKFLQDLAGISKKIHRRTPREITDVSVLIVFEIFERFSAKIIGRNPTRI